MRRNYPSPETQVERHRVIAAEREANPDEAPYQLAKRLRTHPAFIGCRAVDIYNSITRRASRRRAASPPTAAVPVSASALRPAPKSFDMLIGTAGIAVPLNAAPVVAKIIAHLRPEFDRLSRQALMVPELERRVRDLEYALRELETRSPDAALKGENERLRDALTRTEAALDRLKAANGYSGHRPIGEEHLALSGKQAPKS